jgi:predicted esterase
MCERSLALAALALAALATTIAACGSSGGGDDGTNDDAAVDSSTTGDVDGGCEKCVPADSGTIVDSKIGDAPFEAPGDTGPDPTDRSKCAVDPDKPGVTHRTAKASTGSGSMKYVGFAPPGYDPKTPISLVVALHGAGDTMDNYFSVVWQSNATSKNFLVVTPEGSAPIGSGFTWYGSDANLILDVMDDFAKCYSVDPKRQIIHGFSAGGVMAYLIGLEAAELFAGISISSADLGTAEAIAGKRLVPGVAAWLLPLSQTHGTSDTNFPIAQARAGRDRMIAAGHTVYWHEFAGGHTTSAALVEMTYDDLASSRAP